MTGVQTCALPISLKLGYTKTIGEIYESAGIKFDFSAKYVKELANFIKNELEKLK